MATPGASTYNADVLRAQAWTLPLEALNPGRPVLFAADAHWPYFERLRRQDPVHFTPRSNYGPYWSVTRYADIVRVNADHEAFSSDWSRGGVVIKDDDGSAVETLPMFIAMDPPRHGEQRKAVSPGFSAASLKALAPLIRRRAGEILDALPVGEPFDWVERVSTELTAMTLATLFGVPQEDRLKLAYWATVANGIPGHGAVESLEHKLAVMAQCRAYLAQLWAARAAAPPSGDLISMLAHGEDTRDMSGRETLANLLLLMIAGNDTTRNSITGSVVALHDHPEEYAKLRGDRGLIPSMVSETLRWQTPIAHMRRTAVADVELGGKSIRAGDKVVMWYVSGNRDEAAIEAPDAYRIDRPRPRGHLSFGFGIHRCMGARLAELQLAIIWEEILDRFPVIEVTGAPKRVYSSFVRGYETLPVVIPRRI